MTIDANLFTTTGYNSLGPSYLLAHCKSKAPLLRPKAYRQLSSACFANLLGECINKDYNTIFYQPLTTLNADLVKRYFEICKSAHLVSPHLRLREDGKYVMPFGNIPPSLFFIYLCCVRNIAENPSFVKAVVHLVEEKLTAVAAVVFASRFTIGNCNHHFLDIDGQGRCYQASRPPTLDKVKFSINLVIGLRRFLANPLKYDKRNCNNTDGGYSWRSSDCIASACDLPKEYRVTIPDFEKDEVIKAVESETDEEASKLLDKYHD